jgi:hypothetical protein
MSELRIKKILGTASNQELTQLKLLENSIPSDLKKKANKNIKDKLKRDQK